MIISILKFIFTEKMKIYYFFEINQLKISLCLINKLYYYQRKLIIFLPKNQKVMDYIYK